MVPQMIGEGIRVQFINDRPVVSARDLHEALEIGTAFRKWFPRMIDYGFKEGTDYGKVYQKWDSSSTGQNIVDYRISVDMAKHLCMLQRNEKGKMYRQYFLELERAWNSPDKVMARALQIAQTQLEDLRARCRTLTQRTQDQEEKIREIQPKADYLDNVLHSKTLVLTTQIAKDYGMSAVKFNTLLEDLGIQYKVRNQWVLYAQYQDKDYAASTSFEIRHTDGSLEVRYQTEWTQKGRRFLYLTLKEHGLIPVVEKQLMEMTAAARQA